MANLQQCPNGHYYDPGMYSSCPYCSGDGAGTDRTQAPSVTNYDFATAPPKNPFGDFKPEDRRPATAPASDYRFYGLDGDSNGKTVPPSSPADYAGETLPLRPFSTVKGENGAADAEPGSWLVVGWLVAIEGPYRGKSFEIHHGNTYIGREEGDIVLKKDRAVSSSRNANTVYEERKNRYLLVAGQSTNLVYVDDELLPNNSNVELRPYSRIEIGESKFLFVPLCTEKFKWTDLDR